MASADRSGDFLGALDGEELDSYVESALEGSAPVEEGKTNHVFETLDGNIVKVYSDSSLTALLDSFYRLLTGTGSYPDREGRIDNVREVRRFEDDVPMNFPDIEYVGEKSIEFEKVPETGVEEHLGEVSGFRSYDIGYRLGETLESLQERGVSAKIFSLENIKVDGYELYSLDHEFWNTESTKRSRKMEKMLLLSAARDLPEDGFSYFLEGFEDAYGETTAVENAASGAMKAGSRRIFR